MSCPNPAARNIYHRFLSRCCRIFSSCVPSHQFGRYAREGKLQDAFRRAGLLETSYYVNHLPVQPVVMLGCYFLRVTMNFTFLRRIWVPQAFIFHVFSGYHHCFQEHSTPVARLTNKERGIVLALLEYVLLGKRSIRTF